MVSRPSRLTAVVLASLLLPAAAHAEPTSADRETARVLMQEGRELREKGNLKEALKRFKGADDIMHVPTTALEVARAEVALGLLVEARDAIAAIRQTPARPSEPTPFKDARVKADELDASLNGRIPALIISLKDLPAGETPTVTVDGTQVPAGVLGLPRTVDPGHHVVVAKSPHAEGKQEVDVREGDQKPVQLVLVAVAGPPEAPPSSTEPAAESPAPATRSHGPTALTWVGIGIAGAGIATGAVTGLLSMSKKNALAGECANGVCGPAQYADYDAASTFATISTIGFIAAGAGAALSLVTMLVGHDAPAAEPAPPEAAQGATFHPWLGFGAAGVSGRF